LFSDIAFNKHNEPNLLINLGTPSVSCMILSIALSAKMLVGQLTFFKRVKK